MSCKSCGACDQCEMCDHCGKCKKCGRPVVVQPYVQPYVQPTPWMPYPTAPNGTGTPYPYPGSTITCNQAAGGVGEGRTTATLMSSFG